GGFDGAAIDRSRKCRAFSDLGAAEPASMRRRGRRALTQGPFSDLGAAEPASMGPRSIDRGNHFRRADHAAPLVASMGPRSMAEIRDDLLGHWAESASMGPRSIDRGNLGYPRPRRPELSRFDGAAIDRSRK